MTISPGIRLLSPLLAVFFLLLVAGYAVNIPPHRVLLYLALGVPPLAVLRICATRILQRIRARAAGARLVTTARGRWPGNLDILTDLRRAWNVSYPRTAPPYSSLASALSVIRSRGPARALSRLTHEHGEPTHRVGRLHYYDGARTYQAHPRDGFR